MVHSRAVHRHVTLTNITFIAATVFATFTICNDVEVRVRIPTGVFIAGNVEIKPTLRQNSRGRYFTIITVFTNRFSLVEGHWHRVIDRHTVIAWDDKAQLCEKYLEMGGSLAVDGHIEVLEAGKPRIIAENLHFLGLRTKIDGYEEH